MSVREVAAAAWDSQAAQIAAECEALAQAERDRLTRRQERGALVLRNSPLRRWFPSATFDIIDYTGVGTSRQYVSDGTDIIVRSDDGVTFGLSYVSPTEVHVYCVKLMQATGFYSHEGSYYSGPRVNSVEEVGAYLAAQEAAKKRPGPGCIDGPGCADDGGCGGCGSWG